MEEKIDSGKRQVQWDKNSLGMRQMRRRLDNSRYRGSMTVVNCLTDASTSLNQAGFKNGIWWQIDIEKKNETISALSLPEVKNPISWSRVLRGWVIRDKGFFGFFLPLYFRAV
jgi:hypothetical protein